MVGSVRRAIGPADLAWSRTLAHRRALDRARAVIEAAMERGRFMVACSLGKDSIVMLALVAEMDARAPVIFRRFARRQDETPDTERVLGELRSRFSALGWSIVDRASDFDAIRERRAHETIKEARRRIGAGSRAAVRDAVLRAGCVGQHLGLRREESRTRRVHLQRRGAIYWTEVWGMWIACPLAGWSEEDVWAAIAARALPYDGLYDLIGRGARNETSFLKVGDLPRFALAYPQWARTLEAEFGQPLVSLCARLSEEWGGE
jgi:3'-phosphoadenosine 5'-phosphosulfate sulfotransferase (PAPS reductase)/FAD synthetase